MARFDDISDEARHAIIAQAAPLIARHEEVGLGAPDQPLVLGPSLREELLTLQTIRGGVEHAPQSTGQTLSLLQIPGEHKTLGAGPGKPARSFGHVLAGTPSQVELGGPPPADLTVNAVSASDLSTRMQAAIEWIDHNVAGDPIVRVMSVPAYQLTALALHDGDKVVGIVALPSRGDTRFAPERVYSFDEFVRRLRDLPTAEGLATGD